MIGGIVGPAERKPERARSMKSTTAPDASISRSAIRNARSV
jgi:hypothetical protein